MLARLEAERPDELRADFQQFYGLCLDGMGRSYSHAHAACLAAQLPRESRCFRAEEPSAAWGDAEYLLAAIEHGVRMLLWSKTKDAAKGRNAPKAVQTPADRARVSRKLESTDVERVNDVLERAGVISRGGGAR